MESDKPVEQRLHSPFAEAPKFYSNAIRISQSLYDFQIVFGHGVVDDTGEQAVQLVETRAIIHLSPAHCKVLSEILAQQVAAYEKNFGPIPTKSSKEDQKAESQKSAVN